MTPLRIFVIGGHGRVALQFTKFASQAGKVEPLVKNLEELSVDEIADLFKTHDPNVILFAAGAGGKGGEERTFKVDRDGAIKVFDAIEKSQMASKSTFARFLLVSAIDVRDVKNTKPDWYGEDDFKTSERMRKALPAYMQAKYEADLNLSKRKSFPWTVLRPSTLLDEPVGKVTLAQKKTIAKGVPRESVAMTLLKIAELPKGTKGSDGKMWDLTAGEGDIQAEVENAVKRNTTDWVG